MDALDLREAIEIGPLVDGSYCFVAPDSEPIVTRGPLVPNKLDVWYLAVVAVGSRGHFYGVTGTFPARQFLDKTDAVALHDMILSGAVKWQDAIEVPITSGKRGLLGRQKLLVGESIPSVADLHRGRRGLR